MTILRLTKTRNNYKTALRRRKSNKKQNNWSRQTVKNLEHTEAGSWMEKGSGQILQASSKSSSMAAALEDDPDNVDIDMIKDCLGIWKYANKIKSWASKGNGKRMRKRVCLEGM